MNFRTERCLAGNNIVTLVTDFDGTVTMVICPDYEYASGGCALKRARREGSGPLTDFLERVTPHESADACHFTADTLCEYKVG